MVKKIRVLETEEAPVTEEQSMMELAKSMDWKLWEMLQLLQRLEKKLDPDAISDKEK